MNANISPATSLPLPDVQLRCATGEWTVQRCWLSEGLSRDYQLYVELATELPVSCEELIGADGELCFTRGGVVTRSVFGVVAHVEQSGDHGHSSGVTVELCPAFALLDQTLRSRIFQHTSVQDIVSEVLSAALSDYSRELDLGSVSRGSTPREYCVQYRESDRDFVARLLTEEGIAYHYVHDPDAEAERLVLCDANDQYAMFENLDGRPALPLIRDQSEFIETESAQRAARLQRLRPTAVMRRDFDWLTPSSLLTSDMPEADAQGRTRGRYLHTRRRYEHDDLAERVNDTLEAARIDALTVAIESNATGLRPGLQFELEHAGDELDGKYLVLEQQFEFVHDLGGGTQFGARLVCLPMEHAYRPRLDSPRPRVYGPQTATVVGDEEIHTDAHGRIQVQFHWEVEPSYAAEASCWVRCAQSWAGPGWGAQFIPRVGMEVVVEFLEGNPDRPLVTGCVYNGDNPTPFLLPDDKTQSGWRTNSSPDSEGYNMLRFEDAAGTEEIHLHGQRDLTVLIRRNRDAFIMSEESHKVGINRAVFVGVNESFAIGNNRSTTVGNDRSLSIGSDDSQRVGGNRSMSVEGDRSDRVDQGASETIEKDSLLDVGELYAVKTKKLTFDTKEEAKHSVGKDRSLKVGGRSEELIEKDKTFTCENMVGEAKANWTTTVKEVYGLDAGGDIQIKGGAKSVIDIAKELTIQCGKAKITLEKNGNIKIEGNKIELKGKGDIKIKGKKVGAN